MIYTTFNYPDLDYLEMHTLQTLPSKGDSMRIWDSVTEAWIIAEVDIIIHELVVNTHDIEVYLKKHT